VLQISMPPAICYASFLGVFLFLRSRFLYFSKPVILDSNTFQLKAIKSIIKCNNTLICSTYGGGERCIQDFGGET
jgi:hypothetical protein